MMDPKTILELNNALIGIVTSLIGWGGIITLFWIFRNFIIAGISRAFIQVFEDGNDKTKQILSRYLIDKNSTLPEIYECLKKEFKEC